MAVLTKNGMPSGSFIPQSRALPKRYSIWSLAARRSLPNRLGPPWGYPPGQPARLLWVAGVRSHYRREFWKFAWPRLRRGEIEVILGVGVVAIISSCSPARRCRGGATRRITRRSCARCRPLPNSRAAVHFPPFGTRHSQERDFECVTTGETASRLSLAPCSGPSRLAWGAQARGKGGHGRDAV